MSSFRSSGFGNITPMVKNLLIANVAVFILQAISPTLNEIITRYGALYFPGSRNFIAYQFFTYMFLHANLFHILFNMIGLWMFGSAIEMVWGWKRFINYYLACGLGGAVLHTLVNYIQFQDYIHITANRDSIGYMVGASGAIYGLLVAYAYLFPNNRLMMIFLPIPIKAKYFVPLLITIDLIAGLSGGSPIAHFAHIGGAIVGLIFCFGGRLRRWKK